VVRTGQMSSLGELQIQNALSNGGSGPGDSLFAGACALAGGAAVGLAVVGETP